MIKRFKINLQSILRLFLVVTLFSSSQAHADLSCKEVLYSYKPLKHFSEPELIAYQTLAMALLSVRMFKGEVPGYERSGRARSIEYYNTDNDKITEIVIKDMDELLKEGRVFDSPIHSFLRDGFSTNRKISIIFRDWKVLNPAFPRDYLSRRYVNDDNNPSNNTEQELREFLKANIQNITDGALEIQMESKFWAWLKRLLPTGTAGGIIYETGDWLNNPYEGVFFNAAETISAVVVGALLGSTFFTGERYRNGFRTPAPRFDEDSLNRRLPPEISSRFVGAKEDSSD